MTKQKKKKLMPAAFKAKIAKPGEVRNPKGNKSGKRLLTRIREILEEIDPTGENRETNLDAAARKFVREMKAGEFQFLKEIIDRDEGKVPQRIADADGNNVKLYVGMPVDDEDGAP